MVKNEEMRSQGAFSRRVSRYVAGMLRENDVRQVQLADHLGRTQSYVSDRVNGKKSWTLDELDRIASLVKYTSGLELMAEIAARATRSASTGDELAARRESRKPAPPTLDDAGAKAAYKPKRKHEPMEDGGDHAE